MPASLPQLKAYVMVQDNASTQSSYLSLVSCLTMKCQFSSESSLQCSNPVSETLPEDIGAGILLRDPPEVQGVPLPRHPPGPRLGHRGHRATGLVNPAEFRHGGVRLGAPEWSRDLLELDNFQDNGFGLMSFISLGGWGIMLLDDELLYRTDLG